MTKENKAFDEGLRKLMGDAAFGKATNPGRYRAPDDVKKFAPDAPGEIVDLAARLKRIDEKLDSIDGKLEFLLNYLEL
tara:strand:- start:181 stop:414 length:234 start_codon:yes stop_codon:yes gene_type:complete